MSTRVSPLFDPVDVGFHSTLVEGREIDRDMGDSIRKSISPIAHIVGGSNSPIWIVSFTFRLSSFFHCSISELNLLSLEKFFQTACVFLVGLYFRIM
jgi:hypothetical protein